MATDDDNSPASTPAKTFGGVRLLEWTGKLVPQGALVKGAKTSWNLIWKALMSELAPQSKDGSYVRPSYAFRSVISATNPDHPPELGRYHVYVGNACPWCHRVTLTLALLELGPTDVSVAYAIDDPTKASRGGWAFDERHVDPVFGCRDLREVYEICNPGFRGRCTAPLLVDKKTRKIVTNESSEIIRMLNTLLRPKPAAATSSSTSDLLSEEGLCPSSLTADIDCLNAMTYEKINNGVYRAGFATSQEAFNRAARDVYAGLDEVNDILSRRKFLTGDLITEADVRLFPTVVRFDAAYAPLFLRSATRRLSDYPHLQRWAKHIYSMPGVADTMDIRGFTTSYFGQLFPLNPSGIIPSSPTPQQIGLVD